AEPTDTEYLRIKEIEAHPLLITFATKRHPLITKAERELQRKTPDAKGLIQNTWEGLDITVSPKLLDRALAIMNAIIFALESEGFPVTTVRDKYSTTAKIFGHSVPFALVERYRE